MPEEIELTLQNQIDLLRELMHQDFGHGYLLMPYYKKLLEIGSGGDLEPDKRPWVENL